LQAVTTTRRPDSPAGGGVSIGLARLDPSDEPLWSGVTPLDLSGVSPASGSPGLPDFAAGVGVTFGAALPLAARAAPAYVSVGVSDLAVSTPAANTPATRTAESDSPQSPGKPRR
jgi:hypothetical protein